MRDELFDRDFQNGRDGLNNGIDQLGHTMLRAFETLTAIQFQAPWKSTPKRDEVHCG